MGWSCRADAAKTAEKWAAACVAQTGSQNVFRTKGRTYFWENSRKEYDDGAITGSVFRMLGNGEINGTNPCVKSGSFRIEGDGTVARAPKFLKDATKEA